VVKSVPNVVSSTRFNYFDLAAYVNYKKDCPFSRFETMLLLGTFTFMEEV
jgi:hypothetical protein